MRVSRISPTGAAALLLLSLLFVVTGAYGTSASTTAETELKAGVFDPPRPAPEFSLRGSDGAEVTLARYRGKIVLMAFGFTNCAAVCPTTLATLAAARAALGEAAKAVQVIFVTVDPERDDATTLKEFLAAFDPTFVGATGGPEMLAAVRRDYGITAIKHVTSDGYVMEHTSSIYIIDRSSKLRAMMPFGYNDDAFVHDVKLLLTP